MASSRFPSTHWSLVMEAAVNNSASQQSAMGRLIEKYLGPLRMFLVAHMRISGDRADEFLQSFVCTQVLERGLISSAAPGKGRFRNYLMVSLERFVLNQLRYERAECRHGKHVAVDQIDDVPIKGAGPGDAVDRAWAREVLKDTAARMRSNCIALGRPDVWGVFEKRVLTPAVEGLEPMPYTELVREFHLGSPAEASNILITGKRMFIRCLRAVVGEYEGDDAGIDEEIRQLREIVSRIGA